MEVIMQEVESEWRCHRCNKLLGLRTETRVHLRFARGHEYLVGLPVTATCRGCRTLNEIPASSTAAPITAQAD
jgi:phage FluMu protein Com